ncbi:MAG: helix-turn-helix domain-containing protein [Rhodothermales bacterium]|jgi:transcriptional regulator of acetoin/glycerol metabolism
MKDQESNRVDTAIPTLDHVVSEAERAHIQRVLDVMKGNVSEAALTLGLTRQGLYKKMKRLGLRQEA